MRDLEYSKLADETKGLQSDMRRLELTVVAAVGGITAFLLTEKFGKDFLFFGAFVPLVITLAAALRYTAYYYQLKRIRTFLIGKEAEDGYAGWETYMSQQQRSRASRLATLSSFVFWIFLLIFSCAFVLAVLAYD